MKANHDVGGENGLDIDPIDLGLVTADEAEILFSL
jgi:hypothetical protein